MPALVSPRFALSIALSIALAGLVCGSADAQLQWQSTGVQQASHQTQVDRLNRAIRPAPRKAKPQQAAPQKPRPQAKAPTAVAKKKAAPAKSKPNPPVRAGDSYVAQRAMHSERVARQGSAILREANHGLREANRGPAKPATAQRGAVQVCHDCGCGPAACDCGPVVDPSFGCDVGGCDLGGCDCGVGCGDPCGCGDIACGGPCCGNDGCCGECGCGNSCGACSYGGCRERGAVPLILFVPPIRELTVSAGVQAFKGPLDAERDRGNFGFNESVNAAGPMSWLPWKSLGYQIGYRATHSQLHGSAIGNTADAHTQHFLTAGLFRRKPVGLQYGLVYDWLQDERIERAEFSQLRGLISVTNPKGFEWGFQFATGLNNSDVNQGLDALSEYDTVDQYLLFCRKKNQCGGGEFRLFGGVTDDSEGILGADADIPFGKSVSLRTGFAYLIPEGSEFGQGAREEHWNLGMNLVWHFGGRAKAQYCSPFRPLFNVADNGSFFVDSLNNLQN